MKQRVKQNELSDGVIDAPIDIRRRRESSKCCHCRVNVDRLNESVAPYGVRLASGADNQRNSSAQLEIGMLSPDVVF